MPIVQRQRDSIATMATGALPDPAAQIEGTSPSTADTIDAAFRQSNPLVSWGDRHNRFRGISNEVDPAYSAWQDIRGTPYEEHWDSFVNSNNRAYTDALKRQIDTEEHDRRTVAASGWTGTISSIAAGIADPSLLIPLGGQISGARGVYRIGRAILGGAVAGGVGTALQEVELHGSQELRTGEESAYAVGGGIVLGGLLGGAFGAMSRGERQVAQDGYDRLTNGEPHVVSESSAGAMATPVLTAADTTIAGRSTNFVARMTQFISPNMRINQSPSAAVREIGQGLAENTMYQAMHAEGRSIGPAVETVSRVNYRARMADAEIAHRDIFKEMRQTGVAMSHADFEEAVGRAMRRNDVGDNDFISRAAKSWRERVVAPYFNDARTAGIFEDGEEVKFAESYFPRQYNTRVLTANEATVKQEWNDYMEGFIARQYQEEATAFRGRDEARTQELADLRLSPDERAATLADLEQRGEALDAANPASVDRVSQVNDLRRQAKTAQDEGRVRDAERLRDQARSLHAEGGQGHAAYLRERGNIRARYRRVDLNYAGLESRQQRVLNSIDQLQEANARGLNRLVRRGQTFQRQAERLNPERVASQLSNLRSSFADVLSRSQRAQDRIARAAERLGDDAPAALAERLQREGVVEAARHERLTSLAERIERAERLDPEAAIDEARAVTDELVGSVSDRSLRRGAKAERLRERLAALDPKRLDSRVDTVMQRGAADEARFRERYETQRLGQGVDPRNPDAVPGFRDQAREIVDEVFDRLTGRDYGSGDSVSPEYLTPVERGPVRERTLPIPDEILERQGVLNNNAREVLDRYARVLGADTELTNRFGSPTLADQLQRIREEYRGLREQVADQPKKLAKLRDRENQDVSDLQALRDLVRGTYKARENLSGWGRVTRAASHINYIRSMGGAVPASISDLYRIPMAHGLGRFMGEGVAPLMSNIRAVKLAVREAQLAGQVTERVLQSRLTSLAEIADPMARGNPIERTLENGSKIASKLNGIQHWTDGMKAITSILSQNRILNGAADARTLAYLGIDGDMARSVQQQFAEYGQVLNGVHVANTERWTSPEAVRAFRSAVSKDVDSIIVTPSVGDTPLFAHTPTGRLILQFRSFMFASHQRVLLRGMQEGPASFISGMVGMTALGMMAATFKAWRGGRDRWEKFEEAARNPGYLIGEGLDNSGVFTLPFDMANTTEKLSNSAGFSFNPIKSPILAAGAAVNPEASRQAFSVRYASRGPWGTILGPSAGMVENLFAVGQGIASARQGHGFPDRARNAAESFIPLNSYVGMREMIQALNHDSPYVEQE